MLSFASNIAQGETLFIQELEEDEAAFSAEIVTFDRRVEEHKEAGLIELVPGNFGCSVIQLALTRNTGSRGILWNFFARDGRTFLGRTQTRQRIIPVWFFSLAGAEQFLVVGTAKDLQLAPRKLSSGYLHVYRFVDVRLFVVAQVSWLVLWIAALTVRTRTRAFAPHRRTGRAPGVGRVPGRQAPRGLWSSSARVRTGQEKAVAQVREQGFPNNDLLAACAGMRTCMARLSYLCMKMVGSARVYNVLCEWLST